MCLPNHLSCLFFPHYLSHVCFPNSSHSFKVNIVDFNALSAREGFTVNFRVQIENAVASLRFTGHFIPIIKVQGESSEFGATTVDCS